MTAASLWPHHPLHAPGPWEAPGISFFFLLRTVCPHSLAFMSNHFQSGLIRSVNNVQVPRLSCLGGPDINRALKRPSCPSPRLLPLSQSSAAEEHRALLLPCGTRAEEQAPSLVTARPALGTCYCRDLVIQRVSEGRKGKGFQFRFQHVIGARARSGGTDW